MTMLRNLLIISVCAFSANAIADNSGTEVTLDKNVTPSTDNTAIKEKALILSYGYVTTGIEDADIEATGWRVDIVFEPEQNRGEIIHGLGIGYIESNADQTISEQTSHYKLMSVPLYYEGKFLFGKQAFQGFLKGALGGHYSEYSRTGSFDYSSSIDDLGFYAGASAGVTYAFNKKVFVNLEYEWNYLSSSYYRGSYMGSAILGVGIKM